MKNVMYPKKKRTKSGKVAPATTAQTISPKHHEPHTAAFMGVESLL